MGYYINEIDKKGNIAVDDTILVKGTPATAGSKMLENFVPLFSAEAVTRLENKGYKISGKTSVGEFGLDLVGETSYFKGEKAAAAALVSDKSVKAALSVDLNGAPRRAAALKGVEFLKPTYGTVSRYGIIAAACSGEQIGVTARTADEIAEIMSVIAGHDDKDGTSLRNETYNYTADKKADGMMVALVEELSDHKAKAVAESLSKLGVKVESVSIKNIDAAATAWQILMSAEITNNLSRFDGVKYGHRAADYKNIDELYTKSRTEGFGFLAKATILYGSDVLSKSKYDACYDKSLRVRTLVIEELSALFGKYDALITGLGEYKDYALLDAFKTVYEASRYTALSSISGTPALVVNGAQLMGGYYSEGKLLSLAKALEKEEA